MKALTIALFCTLLCAQDPESRARALVGQMTREEKISQLMHNAPPIERLGVPGYNWWNEALHGVARSGRATVFPEPIGLAATWDTPLILRVSTAIGDEARAKFNEFQRKGKRQIFQGLTFWSPNINLFRDPRWGRGMETFGEDPYLTSKLGVAFVNGIQGDDPVYLKAIATPKHFAVHSGPEANRHSFDAKVAERDLRESYLPHFKATVQAGAASVMCAYNRLDGVPACASPRLLDEILRKEYGFKGYVVSDCGAISDIHAFHKVTKSPVESAAMSLKAGTDLACGSEYRHLGAAFEQGLIADEDLDRAAIRLFTARYRLGLFDDASKVSYARIPYSVNDSAEHRRLAVETAAKSIVLLKNEGLLPLAKTVKKIAVVGPNAADASVMLGNYNGEPTAPVTPLAGLIEKLGPARVVYARGSDLAPGLPRFEVIPAEALSNDQGAGLRGEYYPTAHFDGKDHRAGDLRYATSVRPAEPEFKVVAPVYAQFDREVNFQWWDGAPRGLKDDDFGIRWTGYLTAPEAGKYSIGAIGMNGFTLTLGGKVIARTNNVYERSYVWGDVELKKGERVPLQLDYHEYIGDASIELVWSRPVETKMDEALAAAKESDVVVALVGLSPRLEGEEMKVPVEGFKAGDRLKLEIPAVQEELLKALEGTGKPLVVVLMNGSAVAVPWIKEHAKAVVELWYPGQAGGTALADVLFGDANPGGRLPVTFYRSTSQLPAFEDYSMQGRTYRFFEGEALWPFGYGLSYTKFGYADVRAERRGGGIEVTATVENRGGRAGDEVVQVYVEPKLRGAGEARRRLAGFERVTLRPGEKRSLRFVVEAAGEVSISVGGRQPGGAAGLDTTTTEVKTVEVGG